MLHTRECESEGSCFHILFRPAKEVREGPPRSAKGSMEDMGRYGEIWGDVGRYGEIWGEHTSSCMEVSTRNGLRVIALPSRERLRSSACTAFTPRQ